MQRKEGVQFLARAYDLRLAAYGSFMLLSAWICENLRPMEFVVESFPNKGFLLPHPLPKIMING